MIDKYLHAIVGILIYGFLRLWFPSGLCLLAVLVVMAAKEWYDYVHPARHTPDGWDVAAGFAAPCLLAALEDIYVALA